MGNFIKDVLIGGNHLATVLINNDIMPDKVNTPDEIKDGDLRDVYIAWRSIMNLSMEIKRVKWRYKIRYALTKSVIGSIIYILRRIKVK